MLENKENTRTSLADLGEFVEFYAA